MRNIWTLLVLTATAVFLSHCGPGDGGPRGGVSTEEAVGFNSCIEGVYAGSDDILWNSFPVPQNLGVSIAFSGNSALIQVKGGESDVLCTLYEGITAQENENKVNVITAASLSTARFSGENDGTLAKSLANSIQVMPADEDGKCGAFNISSIAPDNYNGFVESPELDTIQSSKLKRNDEAEANFNELYEECGSVGGGFSAVDLSEEAEESSEAEEETA